MPLRGKRPSWACAEDAATASVRAGWGEAAGSGAPRRLCAGWLGGAGFDPRADATQSLGVEGVLSLLDAAGADRCRMRGRPTVRQEIK